MGEKVGPITLSVQKMEALDPRLPWRNPRRFRVELVGLLTLGLVAEGRGYGGEMRVMHRRAGTPSREW